MLQMPSISSDYTDTASKGKTVTVSTSSANSSIKLIDASFLETGFGMRNVQSFQDALREQENRKLRDMYITLQKTKDVVANTPKLHSHDTTPEYYGSHQFSEAVSQTDMSSNVSLNLPALSEQKEELQYLIGVVPESEEGDTYQDESKSLSEEEQKNVAKTGTTQAMRQAQSYLGKHKIFEFFQFLTAHLLSETPGIVI